MNMLRTRKKAYQRATNDLICISKIKQEVKVQMTNTYTQQPPKYSKIVTNIFNIMTIQEARSTTLEVSKDVLCHLQELILIYLKSIQ